jgi:hypothetical protein
VSLQLCDTLAVPEVVRLWLAVSDTLWLELRELTEAVVPTDTLEDFVSAGVEVAVPATLLDSVSLCVWLKLTEALAVPPGVRVADQVMLALSLELPVWEAVTICVPDLVVLNDELTIDDELGVAVAVCVALLEPATVPLQLPDVLAVSEAVRLWLAVSDTLRLELRELTKAVVLTDTLADFVSVSVEVAVPARLLDSVSLRVRLKLAEALAVPPGVGVADKVMLELLLELPVWEAVAISVPDLVLLNDELMPEDELRVGVAV